MALVATINKSDEWNKSAKILAFPSIGAVQLYHIQPSHLATVFSLAWYQIVMQPFFRGISVEYLTRPLYFLGIHTRLKARVYTRNTSDSWFIKKLLRPWWITPSLIYRILHILRKPNSITVLLFIQNIFKLLKEKMSYLIFAHHWKITQTARPQVFSVNSSIICSGLHVWRHFDVIGSIICSGLHFWRHWLNMTKFFPSLVNSSWLW